MKDERKYRWAGFAVGMIFMFILYVVLKITGH
jgi:tetrahydromethanopterin S-methyltransferase subunit F